MFARTLDDQALSHPGPFTDGFLLETEFVPHAMCPYRRAFGDQ
ncbi:hypothetical protein I546_7065 [Mycobacterium kansasii 732]|nr:hypothetical protein I546_7065 [Mycobacterium kansasii 732]